DRRVGGAIGQNAAGHDPDPSRVDTPLADRPAGRSGRGGSMTRRTILLLAWLPAAPALAAMRTEEVWIPMKDGVRLAATLYRPDVEKRGQRRPVVFEYLPYRKDDGTFA